MLGKVEGKRRRGWQRMSWLDSITDSMDMSLKDREPWYVAIHGVAKSWTWLSDWTTTINSRGTLSAKDSKKGDKALLSQEVTLYTPHLHPFYTSVYRSWPFWHKQYLMWAWSGPSDQLAKYQPQESWILSTYGYHTEKMMAPHSSTLAWRIPGMGDPGGQPFMGSHRVGHDWSDLAAAWLSYK